MSVSPEALLKRLIESIVDAVEVHERDPHSTVNGMNSDEWTLDFIRSRAKLALHMVSNTYELTLKTRNNNDI